MGLRARKSSSYGQRILETPPALSTLLAKINVKNTAQKVVVFGVILVRIFPRSGWIGRIGRDTEYLPVFSLNARKCGPE